MQYTPITISLFYKNFFTIIIAKNTTDMQFDQFFDLISKHIYQRIKKTHQSSKKYMQGFDPQFFFIKKLVNSIKAAPEPTNDQYYGVQK